MQKFVSNNFKQKKYKRKYRTISQKLFLKLISSKQKSYKIVRAIFFSMIALSVVWFLIFLFLEKVVFSYEKYFHQISFEKSVTEKYNDNYLYAKLKENLIWMHYWSFSLSDKFILLNKIQDKYVFVDNIKLTNFNNWYASFDIDIKEPMFLIKSDKNQRAIYNNYFYKLSSGDKLWQESPVLYLPRYLSWTDTLSGIFFEIEEKDIYDNLVKLQKSIPNLQKVVYLAWGEKMIVILPEWKKVIFNNNNPIWPQIEKFLLISQNNFINLSWVDPVKIRQIDMWSLEYPIISFW